MVAIILLFGLIGLVLLWFSSHQRKAAGMPSGRVIFADTDHWGPVEKPLYDAQYGLTGEPDYLVEQKDRLIPVEVKSRQIREGAPDGHIFQLAAYCLLVWRVFGKRPPYGILHYPNRTLAVDFNQELEETLIGLIDEMRGQERSDDVGRSHNSTARCARCGYRSICDQVLH